MRVVVLEKDKLSAVIKDDMVEIKELDVFDGKINSVFLTKEQILELANKIVEGE